MPVVRDSGRRRGRYRTPERPRWPPGARRWTAAARRSRESRRRLPGGPCCCRLSENPGATESAIQRLKGARNAKSESTVALMPKTGASWESGPIPTASSALRSGSGRAMRAAGAAPVSPSLPADAARTSVAYLPPAESSSSCVPSSTTRPESSTTILSAWRTVLQAMRDDQGGAPPQQVMPTQAAPRLPCRGRGWP